MNTFHLTARDGERFDPFAGDLDPGYMYLSIRLGDREVLLTGTAEEIHACAAGITTAMQEATIRRAWIGEG